MTFRAPEIASEILTGAVQVTPPSLELRYQMFHASWFPPFVCANQTRASPPAPDSTTGAVACSLDVESVVRADHVDPPLVDRRAKISCLPPGVVAPAARP